MSLPHYGSSVTLGLPTLAPATASLATHAHKEHCTLQHTKVTSVIWKQNSDEKRATMSIDAAPSHGVSTSELGQQRWGRLLPIVFVTYSLAYLDQSNFSIAVAGGMQTDLKLTSAVSALIGAAFFLGYFALQVPGAMYAERGSVKKLIFWSLIAWGTLASLQGLISNVALLIVVLFLSRWFTKAERGRANTYLILGNPVTVLWLTVISGYLIQATSWRTMFIFEGLPAIAWAFVFRKMVSDRPHDATWLNPAERDALEDTIAAEQAALPDVKNSGFQAAIRSRNGRILSVQYLLWSLGIYGFVFWLPTMVKAGSGQGIGLTGVISGIPYALAVVAMLINSRLSDRSGQRGKYVWPWLVLGAQIGRA